MTMARCDIKAKELPSEDSAAFGDVIEHGPGASVIINGNKVRHHYDHARAEVMTWVNLTAVRKAEIPALQLLPRSSQTVPRHRMGFAADCRSCRDYSLNFLMPRRSPRCAARRTPYRAIPAGPLPAALKSASRRIMVANILNMGLPPGPYLTAHS